MVLFQQVDFFICVNFSDSPNLNYYSKLYDLTHILVTCSRLSELFQLTLKV